MNEMDLRQYDPAIARWVVQDPVVHHNFSPYSAFDNNPAYWTDPSGADAYGLSLDGKDVLNAYNTLLGSNNSARTFEAAIQNFYSIELNEDEDGFGIEIGDGDGNRNDGYKPPSNKNIPPWQLGIEWLTGVGPKHRTFTNGDYMTEMLKKHEHIEKVRELAKIHALNNKSYGNKGYKLGGIEGIGLYINDYSNLLTGGATGNLAVTYLGSYSLSWSAFVNYASGEINISYTVKNSSSMQSALRPPILGYLPIWQQTVGKFINSQFQNGWGSKTTQTFIWNETLNIK